MQKNSFYKNVFRLALPVAAQNALATCANMVDTAMVAGLGDAEISAVGVSGKWMFLMNVIIWGIGAGVAAQISQYWGADEKDNMRRTQCTAFYLCVGIAFVYLAAAWIFPRQLIGFFNNEPAVIDAGVAYIRIAALGAVPSAIASVCSTARRAIEDVKVPMFIAGGAVLVNTFLNYIFIFGNFGAPRMGVSGAALATAISLVLQASVFIVLGLVKKHYSVISVKDIAMLDKAFVKKFMSISLPAGLNEALWGIGVMVCAAVFAHQGSENYAAYTIFDSVSSITFVFFQGLAAASAVMVGKTVGAGYLKKAYLMAKRFMIATPIMGLAAGMLLILLKKPIFMIFSIDGGVKEEIISALIVIYGFWLGVRMINYTGVCGIFRAGGDSKFGVFLDLIGLYCCAIPAVLIAAYVFKVPFIALVTTMLVFDDGSKVFITLHHFRSRKWIKKLTRSGYIEEDEEC